MFEYIIKKQRCGPHSRAYLPREPPRRRQNEAPRHGSTSVPLLTELHLQLTQYANTKLRKPTGIELDWITQMNSRLTAAPILSLSTSKHGIDHLHSGVEESPMLIQLPIGIDFSCRLHSQSASHPTLPSTNLCK